MPRSASLETGVIYCDDNLQRMVTLPSESVDLIYLDPPFFSNRIYEVIWGDEAEVRSFEDRWGGGMQVYINWMRDRCLEMHRLLKLTGSLYLHCDPHASHYLKVMLDDIFGMSCFRNEIVWQRTASKGYASRRLSANHDLILAYGKSESVTWNGDAAFIPYDEAALDPKTATKYKFRDADGRLYRLSALEGPSDPRPNLTYEVMGA